MSDVTIAKLGVTLNDGAYRAEKLLLKMAVNTVPTATVTAVPAAASTVYQPMADGVLDDMRQLQEKRLSGELPGITMKITDGLGNNATMYGFQAAPIMAISKSSIEWQMSVIGTDSVLDALDMSVYESTIRQLRQAEAGSEFAGLQAADSGDIAGTLAAVTKILSNSLKTPEDPLDLATVRMRDNINKNAKPSPLNTWLAVLGNSTGVVYKSWSEAAKNNKELGTHLAERMVQVMAQSTSGFWAAINNLLATFQLIYIPSLDGNGKIALASVRTDPAAKDMTLHPSGISLADGSSRILRCGGVALTAAAYRTLRQDENTKFPMLVAQYPDPILVGYLHRDVPPGWLLTTDGQPVLPDAGASDQLSVADYQSRLDEAEKKKTELNANTRGVMSEYAEQLFKSIQLADSTATITIPFDLSPTVGERYTFRVGDGRGDQTLRKSFEGFVSGVTHSIDLRQGKQLDSFTQIMLTHVKF